jgi:cysteine-rich repeat protein
MNVDGVFRSLNGGSSWQATGLGAEMCGDGLAGCNEECDDRGESATCDANCTLAECTDGTLNVTAGEQCDDGNNNPFDGCTNDCTVCGDGVITPPEECDDGNTLSGDACDAQCQQPCVVGTGTPQSCTEAEFEAALAERSMRFNCGPAPVTITLTSEKVITASTTIDGGGGVTLSGGGVVQVFMVQWTAGLELRNLTIGDGRGAIVNNGGTLVLTNCTLSDNSGGDFGGGIANLYGTVTLANCTLSSNSGGDHGCGISNWGNATLTNCTLNGTSIFNSRGCFGCTGGGTLTLANTIVANSPANSPSEGDCTAWITDGGHNLIENATNPNGLTNGVNGNIVGVDPLLGPLANNGGPTQTIALLPNSPAINAGDPAVCVNAPVNGVDQRGYARPGSGHTQCSIGAYEADAFSPEWCVGDCDGTGSVTVDEVLTMVNIALGNMAMAECEAGDDNDDGQITIDEILRAVNNALSGCGGNVPRS